MKVDETKRRRRRGPEPLPAGEKRVHTISTRLNDAELALLDERRKLLSMERGEYLRTAALHILPKTVPEINREAFSSLSRVASNINQLSKKINIEGVAPFDYIDLQALIVELRSALINARAFDGDNDEIKSS